MASVNHALGFRCLNGGMEIVVDARPDMALPLQQHPLHDAALRMSGRRVRTLTARIGGRTVGHVSMSRGVLPVWSAIRGPVWSAAGDGERADAMHRFARAGLRVVEADAPCRALPHAGFLAVTTPAHVAELDLRPDPVVLRAALSGAWRTALGHAERRGLRIGAEPFAGDADHWLFAAVRRDATGYRPVPARITAALARVAPGAAELWCARHGGDPVAAMLILRHGSVATYHTGWSGPEGRRVDAHRAILWAATRTLARDGVARLDLGAVDTVTAPGLARFKIGTGAALRALGGGWIRIGRAGRAG